jgi:uracil-DNA glycosylase family 4
MSADRAAASGLADLRRAAAACTRCPRMAGVQPILAAAVEPPQRPVLFVAEAPGRRGAVRTGRPLTGDASGRVFDQLLDAAGWSRADVAVTNAVLCWPRAARGGNAAPTRSELRNCAHHLAWMIDIVDPLVVAALGRCALDALRLLAPLQAGNLSTMVGAAHPWRGRFVVALYHPSPRVLHTRRSLAAQRVDFARLRSTLVTLTGQREAP